MGIKRKDFQKAAAFIHEFLLKLHEDGECAELRDSLNLALLHMQKYYRILQIRNQQERAIVTNLSLTARGLSPMTPFVDAPDKFQYKWINLDSARLKASIGLEDSVHITTLPPIIQAAREGNIEVIDELINEDPSSSDEQDGLGRSALTYAVHYQQMSALQRLLEHEANPNISAHDGSTAIHQACHDSNSMALSLLLQYGGDFTIPDTQGRAPIHWAVTTPNTECLQLLIHHHADVNIRDKDGLSPCMWACRLDFIHHFELLCQSENFRVDDADGIERDVIGRTWMHWSVRRMEPLECLQTLLTSDTASMKDSEGRTVLLTAAEMGSLAACKIILEIGGMQCINDTDVHGRNALHLASMGGHGDVVNYLLDNSADLSAVDKYNATPWDYAKNRQLHYCQLIIMSHQRQRLASNPTSPLPNGFGLLMNGSLNFSRDFGSEYDYASTRGSVDSMPITPPHPPKRPRTSRMPVRRSRSLGSQDRDKERITTSISNRESYTRESTNVSNVSQMDRRQINSAGEMQSRPKERIEVSVHTRNTDHYDREENAMAVDDNPYEVLDDDLDGVSAGGMDVSDIEDEDERPMPATARGPPVQSQRRGPGGPLYRPQGPPAQQSKFTPSPPPPRYGQRSQMSSQGSYSQASYSRRSTDFVEESQNMDLQPRPPMRASNPAPGAQRGAASNFYNNKPTSPTPGDTYGSSRPRPAPRPQRMQPQPPKAPSPTNRPSSGSRDQLLSPPAGDQSNKDGNRPDSAGKPGVLEGKKIMPPPMLMPLENAPKPPSLNPVLAQGLMPTDKPLRKKKKKKRDRSVNERDLERETDVRSPPEPPENLTPPRGYAAPLHPPPSATTRPQRAQSGIPSPKYSKGAPQKHENQRYPEENMDEEKDDSSSRDDKPPMVNGMAVQIREGPMRSAKPGKRLQPMETNSEDYDMNGNMENGDVLQDAIINEDEEVGPLIPPPQGFRGPSARPGQGRPLSQSVPQDSRSNTVRQSSAKPPLPRGRPNASTTSMRYKNPSPPRRPSRPPTGRNDS